MTSSARFLGTAVGFGFGAVWMTVGVGSAIIVLLCAALGYGVVYVAERERAGFNRVSPSRETPATEDLLVDDFELEHFERHDEAEEDLEAASISSEIGYGWPQPDRNVTASLP